MAVVLSPDGTSRALAPANGRASFTLEELQTLVGGYIQAVPIGGDKYLVCNEDGKRMSLPPNAAATRALHAAGGMPDDTVVGEVLIASHAELGGGDEDGDEG
jgi:Domain of unknown function (DUF3846)